MVRTRWLAPGALLLLLLAHAQRSAAQTDAVRVVRGQDAMSPVVYAYARSEGNVIERIDDRGITFTNRDPVMVWACVSGSVVVVYRYDVELFSDTNSTIEVRYRLDDRPPSPTRQWTTLGGMSQSDVDLVTNLVGIGDSTTGLTSAIGRMSPAAQMPAELMEDFLKGSRTAQQLTIRVTDAVDGESHTDVFPLTGLAKALDAVTAECRP